MFLTRPGFTAEATPTASAPEASASTTTEAAPTTTEPARAVLIIGDDDASGAGSWPALLQDRLDTGIDVAADPGAGYVQTGPTGRVMLDLVEDADLADAEVIVVFGSRNDGSGIADQVAAAAEEVFDSISGAAPDAEPWWSARRGREPSRRQECATTGTSSPRPRRRRVRRRRPAGRKVVARRAGAGRRRRLTLTRAGQGYVADRIEPPVREALAG